MKHPETLLLAAEHALRSYQYGNGSPDLAEGIADAIREHQEQPAQNVHDEILGELQAIRMLLEEMNRRNL